MLNLNKHQIAIILGALSLTQKELFKNSNATLSHLNQSISDKEYASFPVISEEIKELITTLSNSNEFITLKGDEENEEEVPCNVKVDHLVSGYGISLDFFRNDEKPVFLLIVDYFQNKLQLLIHEPDITDLDGTEDFLYSDEPTHTIIFTHDWSDYGKISQKKV